MALRKISRKMIRLVEKNSRLGNLRASFTVFPEHPSDAHMEARENTEERIGAHDLFSAFTADIIRDPQVFVR
jgi:hypothetical protein